MKPLVFLQILVYVDQAETELLWMQSSQSQIPNGAIVAGHNVNGGPLYVARIYDYSRWFAGNYDPNKRCAEYLVHFSSDNTHTIRCLDIWEILVAKYGTFDMT